MDEATFKNETGGQMFFRPWRAAFPANAVMVIVPGFNAHSGYYDWTARELVASGLAV